jgi:hypothetical protein
MIEQPERMELDIIPPLHEISITLNVSPLDLELAVATAGLSLCPPDARYRRRDGGGRHAPPSAKLASV